MDTFEQIYNEGYDHIIIGSRRYNICNSEEHRNYRKCISYRGWRLYSLTQLALMSNDLTQLVDSHDNLFVIRPCICRTSSFQDKTVS